jgi:AhpD family alkylhydroperoxidase
MTMSNPTLEFPSHTLDSAPEASRPVLRDQKAKFGFVAAPVARMATSPALLGAAIRMLGSFEESSLGPVEREVVALTLGHDHGCSFCVALHSMIASRVPELAPHLPLLRAGQPPPDARLGALAAFTRAVVAHRGDVPAETRAAFAAAGFSAEQALDVVLGVATFTLTMFANHLTDAPLDAALERFRWNARP